MITHDILNLMLFDQVLYKKIYDLVRVNNDGTDKIQCFFNNKKQSTRELDINDIKWYYTLAFHSAAIKWANNNNQKYKGKRFHNAFIQYVWINVNHLYLDDIYRKFGKFNSDNINKIMFKKNLLMTTSLDEISNNMEFSCNINDCIKPLSKRNILKLVCILNKRHRIAGKILFCIVFMGMDLQKIINKFSINRSKLNYNLLKLSFFIRAMMAKQINF